MTLFWKIFDLFFIAFVFYIPFGAAFNVAPDVDLASVRVLIIALFLAWLVGAAVRKQRTFSFDFQGLCLLAILIFGTLSLLFAQEAGWGLRKLAVFLSIFPLYFLTAGYLKDNQQNKEKLIKVVFASAAVSSVLGLVQFFSQFALGPEKLLNLYSKYIGPVFWGHNFSLLVTKNQSWLVEAGGRAIVRTFGLFPDPHMLAFFMGLVFPIVLAWLLFKKEERAGLFVICGLLSLALLLTFSRGGYLGITFSILAVIILAWKDFSQKHKRVILSVSLLAIFIMLIFARPVVSRFVSSFTLDEGSSLGRISIWKGSWKIFLGNPLLGVGLGNYPKAIEPLAVYRTPITSHNLYLDILSETGIFGLAAWLFLIFGSMRMARIHANCAHANNRALAVGLFGSLVYFSVHSFFETAIFNPAILAYLMIILALVAVSFRKHE